MEMKNYDSKAARNEQSRRWHLAAPALALLFQLAPPLLLWLISTAAYANPRSLSESWERRISLLTLGGAAGISLFLGSISVFGLLIHARPRVAALLICICCAPALFGGAVYLHCLLVFLTII
jgi:hypothetical protein